MVWCNDPRWVNRGKGYRAVNWLDCSVAIWDVDGIHPSSGYGHSQQSLLLAFRLILVINRATQYVVYSGPRFRHELYADRYFFNRQGGFSSANRLLNISSEVVSSNQPFHQKFKASTSVGLMHMVLVVITSLRLVALCEI